MFSNLLYFLMALVIYTTSELFAPVDGFDNAHIFSVFLISAGFAGVCHLVFLRLEKQVAKRSHENLDVLISSRISHLSVVALIVFAIIIYGFKLTFLFSGIKVFEVLPTLKAVFFIGLYLFFLVIIWNEAFPLQNRYFSGEVSKKDFILSNISFSLPALIPWLCLSIVLDLSGLVPWQPAKDLITSPLGEIGYMALFLIVIAVFGPVFIRKVWRCRPLNPGYVRSRIENICRTTGLTYSDILKWELFGGNMITAGVMGFIGRFRYLLVTPALINVLNDEELDAVILHEIGHVQRYHMIFYLLFFAGFMACNLVFFEPVLLLLYLLEPVYHVFELLGVEKATAHPILISMTLIGAFVLYFRFIFGLFMRNFERQADLHVYEYSADASALISTFRKIALYSRQSVDKPNWHHYSIAERVGFLKRCEAEPHMIRSHHSKVKKMITAYFILLTGLVTLGYAISFGGAKSGFDNFIAEKILLQHLDVDPLNSDLYVLVGDYYYSRQNYAKAIDIYENVLRIDPLNVHALNNLSWLFSTCPEKDYRNKQKALEYATRALAKKREAYVLDTYAEALFANNDVDGAVSAALEALNRSKDKKEYYKGQLERFEKMTAR